MEKVMHLVKLLPASFPARACSVRRSDSFHVDTTRRRPLIKSANGYFGPGYDDAARPDLGSLPIKSCDAMVFGGIVGESVTTQKLPVRILFRPHSCLVKST